MNTRHSLADSRPGPACAAFAPLLPLVSHELLEPAEAARVQAHVAGCAHCRARLAAYRRLDDALRLHLGQESAPLLQSDALVQRLEQLERAEASRVPARLPDEAPPPPLRPSARARPRRVISWVSAMAALLLITLITAALVASHYAKGLKTSLDTPPTATASGIFFSAMDTNSAQRFLYSLDPSAGKVNWQKTSGANLDFTPVLVDQGVLFVLTQTDDASQPPANLTAVYAFRASTGDELWSTPTDGMPLTLVMSNGVLYVASGTLTNGMLYALNPGDGSVKWQTPLEGEPTIEQVANGVVYVNTFTASAAGGVTSELIALNASDGSVKWSLPAQGYFASVQAVNGYLAVVTALNNVSNPTDTMPSLTFALLNASTGAVQWRYSGDPATLGNVFVTQDTVYMVLRGGSGQQRSTVALQALNVSTGAPRWQKAYTNFVLQEVAGGYVYLSEGSSIIALNAQDGSQAWHAQLDGAAVFGASVHGTLYAESSATLYAFNAATGAPLWKYQMGATIDLRGITSQVVYATASGANTQLPWLSRMFALDARTGTLLWHYDTPLQIVSTLIS